MKEHHYKVLTEWTGNIGQGTADYQSYLRDFDLHLPGKSVIHASSDPAFRGDAGKINPEEMLLSALSSCHMLWFLHECADHGINVISYSDNATGTMIEQAGKGGHFLEVTLHPEVVIEKESQIELSESLHKRANAKCFIANSCNFPINHQAKHSSKV